MAEPDFLRTPFDIVADILQTALDPEADAGTRANACARLRQLTPNFLRSLALDGEWKFVLQVLARENEPDGPTEEDPWSTSRDVAEFGDSLSLPEMQHALHPLLRLHHRDLQRLSMTDYQSVVPVVDWPLDAALSPIERISACARALPSPAERTPLYARSIAWTAFNHAAILEQLAHKWPDGPELLAAFWRECVEADPHFGFPKRFAEVADGLLCRRPELAEWFNEIGRWIEAHVARELFEFFSLREFRECHLALRMGVAARVRAMEIVDASMIIAAELYAITHLLRAAATHDLRRAWREGRGDPQAALGVYERYSRNHDTCFDRAFASVLGEPDTSMLARAAEQSRQALFFTLNVVHRDPYLATNGLLGGNGGAERGW